MIQFLVVIEEDGLGRVRFRVNTPTSKATMREASVAREFQQAIVQLQGNGFRTVVTKPWSGANNDPAPTMNIKLYTPEIPKNLLALLSTEKLQYSSPRDLFHLVWLDGENYCGVFGDGGNGAYEWFIFRKGELATSDCGYGDTAVALRDVLREAVP